MRLLPLRGVEGGHQGQVLVRQGEGGVPDQALGHDHQGRNRPLCQMIRPLPGTIEHLLLSGGCPALVDARLSMLSMMKAYMVPRAYLLPIFDELYGRDEKTTMQFLLDCSVLPPIIRLSQESENPVLRDIFYLTRTYVFKLFVTRRRLLGQTTR